MALPKLNDSPKYSLIIPSTKKEVRFRPYLVKEEKVLMIAFESGDQKQTLEAIIDTLNSCIEGPIDTGNLATFDIEYLFTQIRAKSVGETSTINVKCEHCEGENEQTVDVSSAVVEIPEIDKVVQLTPSISVELQFPSYRSVMNTDLKGDQIEVGFNMVMNCIKTILTEEERIEASDVSKEELSEFVESMTQEQFGKLSGYLENLPTMSKKIDFTCVHCSEDNSIELKGMNDFLS